MLRRAARLLLVLGLVGCAAEARQPATTAAAAPGLTGFHRALTDLQAGRRTKPVVILQIGDSHTANDGFSTRMREVLQQRYGNAGRGMLPPGIPFRTYNPDQVQVTASGWQAISSRSDSADGPFGLSGLRQHSAGPGAEMLLASEAPGGLHHVMLEVLRRPDGGSLEVSADGRAPTLLSTRGNGPEAVFLPLPGGAQVQRISLRTRGDGPVDILSWVTLRRGAGVVYANLGTIGATVELPNRWDPKVVATELRQLDPSLLLIAFGTNEGFRSGLDTEGYGALYTSTVRALAQYAPQASVMVMGPPDGNSAAPDRARNAQGCAPDPTAPGNAAWVVPRNLGLVREAQRAAANANGWAFFDWSRAMGGPCSMHRWTQAEPQLALNDHVHLRTAGYRITADVLLQELLGGPARPRPLAQR